MKQIIGILGLLVIFLLGVVSIAGAERILETGPLGQTSGGSGINSGQYKGARFSLDETYLITGVGGHVKSCNEINCPGHDRTLFVVIVPIDGPDGFPADVTFSDAIFSAVFSAPYNDYVGGYPYQVPETIIPTNFVLEPGHYGIVFGSGLFGATGSGWMPLSGPSTINPLFFQCIWGCIDCCHNVKDQIMRFVVEGEPILETINVLFDIKPQSCPNPLNVNSKGVLPVAILGTEDFDVTQIDASTLMLEGVEPIRDSLKDVATPFNGASNDNCLDCTTDGPDGLIDLTLKFDTQELVAVIEPVIDGECLTLTITGNLLDGTPFEGSDLVVIREKGNQQE